MEGREILIAFDTGTLARFTDWPRTTFNLFEPPLANAPRRFCGRLESGRNKTMKDPTNSKYNSLQLQCYEQRKEIDRLNERIKRLEEAGDELMYDNDDMANINRWHKAKEAKP
jgi:hypothetical protein